MEEACLVDKPGSAGGAYWSLSARDRAPELNLQRPIKRKGMAPLFRMAVLAGIKVSVQLHLRLGGDVDATDEKGRTPLVLAASRGHLEICRLLLDAGADPAHAGLDNVDALQAALGKSHFAVAELIRSALQTSALQAPAISSSTDTKNAGPVVEMPSSATGLEAEQLQEGFQASEDFLEDCGAQSLPVDEQAVQDAGKPTPKEELLDVAPSGGEWPLPHAEACGMAAVTATESLGGSSQIFHGIQDEFDLSAWEEETEAPPPPADPACTEQADRLQRQMSRHLPLDTDEAWDDVDIDLPELLASVRRGIRSGDNEEGALRNLVTAAIREGRVMGHALDQLALRDQEEPDRDWLSNLRLVFGELGVVIDDEAADAGWQGEAAEEDEETDHEAAAEGLAFLHALNANGSEPLALYLGELPRGRLAQEDEAALITTIQQGTRRAMAALALSPAAISEILAAFDATLKGNSPAETILVPRHEGDDGDEVEGSSAGEGEGSGRTGQLRPIPSKIADEMRTVCDLCCQILRSANTNPSERLGNVLTELGLSPPFIERLRHIVEGDPHGSEARCLIKAELQQVRRAKDKFITANLALVVWYARKYGGLTWADRIQEGNFGLLKAVERFDHRRGVKFSTYASWWIKQSISRGLADTSRTIRVPVHAQEVLRRVYKVQERILTRTGREADAEEIAGSIGIPSVKARMLLAIPDEPISLDSDDGLLSIEEIVSCESSPEEMIGESEMKAVVHGLLKSLSPKEASILCLRFGIGHESDHTLEEVGQRYGVTRERIRQIEAKALGKLSHPGRIKALRGLL